MTASVASLAASCRRVGYVLKVFPRVSETFVINEIRTLEALGEELCIFSLHHNGEAVPHRVLRELRSPIVYVEDTLPAEDSVPSTRRQLADLLAAPAALHPSLLPRKYVRLATALASQMAERGITHLHAHFASRAAHVAALAAALRGVTYSMTAHAKDIYHHEVDPALLRWKILGARFVVTVTDYNLRHLQRLVADPAARHKIGRLYNGVDLERFHPPAAPAARAGDAPLLLGVGRLVEKKGFAMLVEACRILRDRRCRFACEIVGDGPEGPALQAQIAAAGLEGIVALRGVMSNEEVGTMLHRAAAAVLPCLVASDGNVDALPTVLLEAMAAACPVVSTRVSGIPEIVADGETGFLVPPGEPLALAAVLIRLITDPTAAAAMGRAGRQRAELLFDLRTNVTALQRLFPEAEDRPAS